MTKKPRTSKARKPTASLPAASQTAELHQTTDDASHSLTTNHGLAIADNQNSLKAGERGPTLLEDFVLREKITHFDHERIPERIVHARGSGARGYFQVYEPLGDITKAALLNDPEVKTEVFARFSTVAGGTGSGDLPRDVRGFAVKFYTSEGNYDLVGNNIPVFFIQDAMKFPDLVHAVKMEPDRGFPQAASAHDTFWDFVTLTPKSMHMLMWVMSDHAIPRSLRMIEGFGVHTFRMIDAAGVSRFVKFQWQPKLGAAAVLWDEAVKINGADPDFHRRDLWEAIDQGDFPEWEGRAERESLPVGRAGGGRRRDSRVPADDVPLQGAHRGRGVGLRGIDQLRRPFLRAERRDQPEHLRRHIRGSSGEGIRGGQTQIACHHAGRVEEPVLRPKGDRRDCRHPPTPAVTCNQAIDTRVSSPG